MATNNNETQQAKSLIAPAPSSYMTKAKDIRIVQVQELSLQRLKRHIDAIPESNISVDAVSVFLGGAITCIITICVEAFGQRPVSTIYWILTVVFILIAFVILYYKKAKTESSQVIEEAKQDIEEIFKQAQISEDKQDKDSSPFNSHRRRW